MKNFNILYVKRLGTITYLKIDKNNKTSTKYKYLLYIMFN